MFLSTFIFLAVVTVNPPEELEEQEMALAEQAAVVEEKELIEDGELIFDDDEEPLAELDEEN